ncbi:MAG: metal ABC transporter ATP-binding protein [Candidatus Binatia bacterium]|nr:metal ABC transporter ATP-binding protein [Candidatus Binatia bacterium]
MTTTPALVVETRKLEVRLDGRRVLWDIDLAIPPGRFVGIIGPNGAGKTTLLRVLLGLVPASGGEVRVFGFPPLEARKRGSRIGYVPQRPKFDPFFPVSVWDVVMMGRVPRIGWFRWPRREDRVQVARALELVGMRGREQRRLAELSGGEQQRVFLARALSSEAQLLLLDEATTGLDLPAQHELYALLQRLRQQLGLTIVAVSHDLLELAAHAEELVCINGTMHIHGNPQVVLHSHELREAYRCEFDFLYADRAGLDAAHGGE